MSASILVSDILHACGHFREAPKPELSRLDAIRLTTKAVSAACGVVDALVRQPVGCSLVNLRGLYYDHINTWRLRLRNRAVRA